MEDDVKDKVVKGKLDEKSENSDGKDRSERQTMSVIVKSKPELSVKPNLMHLLEKFVEDVHSKIDEQSCKIDDLKREVRKLKFDESIETLIIKIMENRFESNENQSSSKPISFNELESNANVSSENKFDRSTNKIDFGSNWNRSISKSSSLENIKKYDIPESNFESSSKSSTTIYEVLEDFKRSLESKINYQTNRIDSLANQVSDLSDSLNICSNQYAILLNKYISRAIENPAVIAVQPTSKKERLSSCKVEEDGKALFRPECGEDDRESWDSKLTFLLATVGYAVGLGNVWRFPYLAQKNGGGAFLIPYMVMLAIEGIPIFYLELAIGQRLRKGAIGVWSQVSPFLGGIGISSAVVSFNVALYYNTIIAWCLFYFVQSFQAQLPWAECPKKYFQNGSYTLEPECVASTPTQYFWYRTTLEISESIDNPESFNWKIAFSLFIAWILVYMCMIKGIASSGKVVYVTATFPYIVLIIFFFRGITLKGFSDGVKHLFTPKWYKLSDPVVWLEAGTQIFFSLGLGFGGLIAFSSYNPVNNNCYRDAILVSLTNCFTSMFAGIVVFSIIGFKATLNYENCLAERNSTLYALYGSTDIPFDTSLMSTSPALKDLPECDLEKELDNSASGTGLAFIIFTEAINQFPGAQFWSVLFFLMLFTLGIDSQFGTLEGVVTSIVDMKLFPNLRKEILTGIMCLICFVISLSFAHGAGNYVFILFDNFAGNFPLLIIALCECLAISYIYGLKRFADDLELMVGNRPGLYWMACWKYISPAAMLLILLASVAELVVDGSGYDAWRPESGDTIRKEWPTWAFVLISFLVLVAIIWIPLVAICRAFGIVLVDDNEKAWFPARDLKEFHGIVEHEVTSAETYLFCIHSDGSEGLCCRTYPRRDDDEDDD